MASSRAGWSTRRRRRPRCCCAAWASATGCCPRATCGSRARDRSPREIEALVALVGTNGRSSGHGFRDGSSPRRPRAHRRQRLRPCPPADQRAMVQADDGNPIEAGLPRSTGSSTGAARTGCGCCSICMARPAARPAPISTIRRTEPELFIHRRYRAHISTVASLATRYPATVVMGYDLLNEPLPNEYQYHMPTTGCALSRAHRRDPRRRSRPPHHLRGIALGDQLGDLHRGMGPEFAAAVPPLLVPPDRAGIARYLEARERLGLPIYMGEGGENNLHWLYTAHRLYEANKSPGTSGRGRRSRP